MPTITQTAYSQINGYDKKAALLKTLGIKSYRHGMAPVHFTLAEPNSRANVAATVQAMLEDGKMPPADVAAPIIKAAAVDELARLRVQAINEVLAGVFGTDHAETEDSIEPALDYLRDELTRLMDETRDLAADLDGVRTAADAISRGDAAISAWNRVTELSTQYAEIRAAQRSLYRDATGPGALTSTYLDDTSVYADAINLTPGWQAERWSARQGVTDHTNAQVAAYAEWLADYQPSPIFDSHIEPARQLVLIATTTTPWLPTLDQVHAMNAAARGAIQLPRLNTVDQLEQARTTYWATVGSDNATHQAA